MYNCFYLLFLLTSTSFTICTICFACIIDNPIMSKYGKSTMEIYVFHPFITGVVAMLMSIMNIPDISGIVLSLITLIICCLIIPFIRSFDSNLVGLRNN